MKELAKLIRKGLESGVNEDKLSWGIVDEPGDRSANVIGLALIGKVGFDRARALINAAFEELAEEGPATEEVARQLGVDIEHCEALVAAYFRMSASEIADSLEKGELLDPA